MTAEEREKLAKVSALITQAGIAAKRPSEHGPLWEARKIIDGMMKANDDMPAYDLGMGADYMGNDYA